MIDTKPCSSFSSRYSFLFSRRYQLLRLHLLLGFHLSMLVVHVSSSGSHSCRGGPKGISITECTFDSVFRDYKCRHAEPRTNRWKLMGCEQDARNVRKYWCCPQYCPDQRTQIYHTNLLGGTPPTTMETATTTCTNTGAGTPVCPLPNHSCHKPEQLPLVDFPTDKYYCCPTTNAAAAAAAAVGAVPNGLNIPTITTTPGPNVCRDLGGDCPFRERLCDNGVYFSLMTWQCPVTCKRCPVDGRQPPQPPGIVFSGAAGVSTSSNNANANGNANDNANANGNGACRDMSNCPLWVRNGYCRIDFYKIFGFHHCPVSCEAPGCAKRR